MKNLARLLAPALGALALLAPGRLAAASGPAGEYRIVEASQPSGGGSYRGKVDITSAGATSFRVQWTLDGGDSYRGPGIMHAGVLGVGYGDGLTGLAVYEIKGKTLKAKWLLPATPGTVGDYDLSGPAGLNGFYKFTNGLTGGVSIKPNGKIYDVQWTLPTGVVTGIAVRSGDALVAVSGQPGSNFGVAAYHPVGNRAEGIWAVPGQTGLGTEVLAPASAPAETASAPSSGSSPGGAAAGAVGFSASGAEVRFAGDTYELKDNQSAPGRPTSELREYLRPGETFEQYPKMFALRVQDAAGTDPLTFTRAVLQTVKKSSPTATTSEIAHTDDSATMEFLLVNGDDAEYNFWHYFKMPEGKVGSVQFVLRNKPPYETKGKFKAERTAHFDDWVRDAKTLAVQVPEALARTSKVAAAGPDAPKATAAKKPEMSNDELADKIGADLKVAGGIGVNFLSLLKDGKLSEAAALVADEGFTKMGTTRAEFVTRLQQAQAADGRVQSFAPVKDKTDFGAEPGGGVYFVLVADSKCEKSPTVRETMRFFRFPDGQLKMVGYQRTGGKASAAGR